MRILFSFLLLFAVGCSNLEQNMLINVSNKVVKVMTHDGLGSGVIVLGTKTKKSYVLTNGHICYQEKTFHAKKQFDNKKIRLSNPIIDKNADLCIIPIEDNNSMKLAKSLSLFETIYEMGYPDGEFLVKKGFYLGESVLTIPGQFWPENYTQCIPDPYHFFDSIKDILCENMPVKVGVFNYHLDPGMSGSPAFNINGELVGLFAFVYSVDNSGFVPLNEIVDFLKDK